MPKIVSSDGSIRISGSIIHQVRELLNIATNDSRFGVKVRDILNEGYTKQSNPYIRSFRTAQEYAGVWYKLAEFVRSEYGINKITDVKPEHVEAFIEQKADLSAKSLKNISSAIGKLENVITQKLGIEVNFGEREHSTGRWYANELAKDVSGGWDRGAYESPQAVIERLSVPEHSLVARLQYEGGFRIHEVAGIRESSFVDGWGIQVRGKGGFERTVEISPELWREAKEVVERYGRIEFSYQSYLEELKDASLQSGQAYQGSHGFRYNFAQEKYEQFISEGLGHWEALKEVSELMGHHRPEITMHYLGKGR